MGADSFRGELGGVTSTFGAEMSVKKTETLSDVCSLIPRPHPAFNVHERKKNRLAWYTIQDHVLVYPDYCVCDFGYQGPLSLFLKGKRPGTRLVEGVCAYLSQRSWP